VIMQVVSPTPRPSGVDGTFPGIHEVDQVRGYRGGGQSTDQLCPGGRPRTLSCAPLERYTIRWSIQRPRKGWAWRGREIEKRPIADHRPSTVRLARPCAGEALAREGGRRVCFGECAFARATELVLPTEGRFPEVIGETQERSGRSRDQTATNAAVVAGPHEQTERIAQKAVRP